MLKSNDSLNRITAYLAAKKEVSGLHPEVIHVIHANGGKHELKVSDLEELLQRREICLDFHGTAMQLANELVESNENHYEDAYPIIEYTLSRLAELGYLRTTKRESINLDSEAALIAIERGIDPLMFGTLDEVHRHCSPRHVDFSRKELRKQALQVVNELHKINRIEGEKSNEKK